jgi:hypothetical protein
MTYPEKEKLQTIIESFKKADLSRVTYSRILNTLFNELKIIPYPKIILKAGTNIYRARINRPNEIFKSEAELTYRTDFLNIEEYGRANTPWHAIFYGTLPLSTINKSILVNLF